MWAITSQVANTNGAVTGPNVAGPGASYTANATGTTQTVSASVVSSSLSWAVAYSFTEQSTSGTLTYRETGAGCAGWNVSVKAQPFTYTGTAAGTAIPANNLALTSIGAPTVVAGSASGVSPVNSAGGLGTPRTVLRSTAGSGAGTYEQQLGVTLTVPGGATVGSYRSTITITAASGP